MSGYNNFEIDSGVYAAAGLKRLKTDKFFCQKAGEKDNRNFGRRNII